ncbi:hypothetical protein IW140_002133 [Coemansia sp. RSA 1813]|nr:hypothetical protein EV178_001282 [Coemansia sp. RSA 1646]KAJ1772633.1 hypothetical protein LPJ74_001349 [Coemansia sp. RSA 1843]KAJ2090226.1 hypothetical protein IW138_002858 [Coemansia sp. RSA 986]KAJ2214631.1 hypothetical protein EV179_002890 [Coemansia sp. RSA 487]KAJ2570707.1 hypothetical protein IW140_002133 [Coemansia sp. RSA 1813]
MPLFDEKDEGLVKSFLFNKIEKECDADPGIMADYILVTLQNDMNPPELKHHCKTDLVEFFGDKTNVFVDTLFDSLDRKQYLSQSSAAASAEAALKYHDNNSTTTRPSVEIRGSSSRARDEGYHQRNSTTNSSSRRRSRSPNGRHSGRRRASRSPSRERHAREPRSFDPSLLNGPLEPGRLQIPHQQQQQQPQQIQQQQMFQQNPQQQQQQQQFQRKRRPCFEFLRKGTCQRGDSCTYAHVTSEQAQAMGMQVPQNIINATNGAMPFGMGRPPQAPPGFFAPIQPPQGGAFANVRPPMGQHQPGSVGHQNHQFSSTGIFITNIPDECLNDSAIKEFFGKFGEIRDIRIDFGKHTAIVDFAANNAQLQALSTPEAIFNNRFVRVHKARSHTVSSASGGGNGLAASSDQAQQHSDNAAGSSAGQFAHPQQQQQQQPPVWRPKSAAIKKAEMIEKYVEQQKELMKKLTTIKDMPAATRKIIMSSINQIQAKIDDIRKPKAEPPTTTATEPAVEASNTDPSNTTTEKQALQNKLQALQQEAARLGMSSKGNAVRSPWGGAFAGAGAGAHTNVAASSARGSMSLDKRPRTLVLRNVEQAAAERLDSELAQFGEIESISKVEEGGTEPPFTYTVRYKARWEAENAIKAITSLEGFGSVSADWGQ